MSNMSEIRTAAWTAYHASLAQAEAFKCLAQAAEASLKEPITNGEAVNFTVPELPKLKRPKVVKTVRSAAKAAVEGERVIVRPRRRKGETEEEYKRRRATARRMASLGKRPTYYRPNAPGPQARAAQEAPKQKPTKGRVSRKCEEKGCIRPPNHSGHHYRKGRYAYEGKKRAA